MVSKETEEFLSASCVPPLCSENPTMPHLPLPPEKNEKFSLKEHAPLRSQWTGLLKLMLKPGLLSWLQQWTHGLQRYSKATPRPPTDPLDAGHLPGCPALTTRSSLHPPMDSSWLCRDMKGFEATTGPVQDKGNLVLRSHQDWVSCCAFRWVHNIYNLFQRTRQTWFLRSFLSDWLPLPGLIVNLGVFFTPILPCQWHRFNLLLLPKKKSLPLLLDTCSSGVTATGRREHP